MALLGAGPDGETSDSLSESPLPSEASAAKADAIVVRTLLLLLFLLDWIVQLGVARVAGNKLLLQRKYCHDNTIV